MITFPKNIRFKYSWRKYQQRVLDKLKDHLQDKHLHVIAPPGSGKTILGLEVALRINKPTLILAPTTAIRNQWIQRFCDLFLQTDATPEWISRDIYRPTFLTVVTYQGLHAACNNLNSVQEDPESDDEQFDQETGISTNKNLDSIVAGLKKLQTGLIIVDEAHHLKNEWWQTLTKVKDALDPTIVGLTATPPYDVSPLEWQRYTELNGPVDVEISVPELVMEGDLCPHQDYVFYSLPSKTEARLINDFRKSAAIFFEELKNDQVIITAIINHPVWTTPSAHLEWIYTNLSFYSASLIFLNVTGHTIPESHLEIIGDKKVKIPVFDYKWAEILLEFYLFRDPLNFKQFTTHQQNLAHTLRRAGLLEKRCVNLLQNKQLNNLLGSSISKLDSIAQIVSFEHCQLGSSLRMVILSDYIRKEYYLNATENTMELNKIGVISIFEKLRRQLDTDLKIGVLTGSIIIIPKKAYPAFQACADKYGIKNINSHLVPFDHNYLLIEQNEQLKHDVVNVVTQIFQDGAIEVLIGTKSLLGEGWDAPAINTLILASFVGSYVSSNQMRGRAIRSNRECLDKTGNIWHLACVDPSSSHGGEDIDLLKRRFKSFVGIRSGKDGGIESGARRLEIPDRIQKPEQLDQKNSETLSLASDRHLLNENWNLAIKKGTQLVEEISIPFSEKKSYQAEKKLYLNKTIANLMATLASGFSIFFDVFLRLLRQMKSAADVFILLKIAGVLGVIIFGRLAFKTFRLYIQYRDISKDIQNIGRALLKSLIETGTIKSEFSSLQVISSVDTDGAVLCHLEGGTSFERSTFINALQEILAPVDNPRYFMVRKGLMARFIKQKDYHAVPEVLSRNKTTAQYFKEQWQENVGACDMIFARTPGGRKILLRSRIKSLAAQFENKTERVSLWK